MKAIKMIPLMFIAVALLMTTQVFAGNVQPNDAMCRIEDRGLDFCPDSFCQCVAGGRFDYVSLFLNAGMNPNSPDVHGVTPLIYAAENGHMSIVKALLQSGADVNLADKDKGTALMMACWMGNTDVADLLIKKGAEVNARNSDGWTPLMLAAWNGYIDTVKMLLYRDADINMLNNTGDSAWWLASSQKHEYVADLLIVKGSKR